MKQEKRETRSLCPMAGFAECRQERCALWDDDWSFCSLNCGSRYSSIRAGVCDAAVEVMASASQAMKFGKGAGSPSDPAKAGPPPHCGGEAFGAVIDA